MLNLKTLIFFVATLLLPLQSLASETLEELHGEWRGELALPQGLTLTIGLSIAGESARLLSPNQGPQTYELKGLTFSEQNLSFSVPELGASFTGALQGDQIRGEFEQGSVLPLTFERLAAPDLERLALEGKYAGVLNAGGTELPLHFNIAVVKDGFIGTLDSPAQEAYGIPLAEVKISAQKLSVAAPMLQATYSGSRSAAGTYDGVWFQGMPYPLKLSKVTAERPAPKVKVAEFGTFGGATALLKDGEVTVNYAADHNAETLYEIGSVTKTFVAYLLADAVQREVVELTTELNSIFPEAPEGVTLLELATHTSGLPRLPADLLTNAQQQDPYANYDLAMLESALAKQELGKKQHLYSNYAVGALGEALAKVQETTLDALMQKRIFEPFGMSSTYLAMAAEDVSPQLAVPHNSLGQKVGAWRFKALAGAGAVVSSLPDMVNYVTAMQQRLAEDSALRALMLTPRVRIAECCQQALGWMLEDNVQDHTLVWHNGRTAGFASFVGFYADGSQAVILLSNQAMDVNSQAKRLLTD